MPEMPWSGKGESMSDEKLPYTALERGLINRAEKAEADRDRLREALEWYGDRNQYKEQGSRSGYEYYAPIIADCGKRARDAGKQPDQETCGTESDPCKDMGMGFIDEWADDIINKK